MNTPHFEENNPFTLLGLPARFDLAPEDVQRAYLTKAAQLHPDRFTDVVEQADAVRKSAAVNDARKQLLNPETRANILLKLMGGPGKSDDKTLPPDFLMEIMQIREEMEEDAGSEEGRLRWQKWADEQRNDYLERIGDLFAKAEDGGLSADIAHSIRMELNALRYIERMIEQLDPDYDHQSELNRADHRN
ncbi:MAG TPA: hypothetical protein ENJ06_00205 [Phycisphaeraceae bacterium]|nr:hypothetical protein [Phycisphaeraceae bacterium]